MIIKLKNGIKLKDTTCDKYDPVIYKLSDLPIKIYGVNEELKRMPKDIASEISEPISRMGLESTGGRISFKTNTDYIIIHANIVPENFVSPYSSLLTYAGFEIKERKYNNWVPLSYVSPSQGPGKDYIEGRGMFEDGKCW